MVLSDRDIKYEIARGRLVIKPFDPACIQPASVDIHLGNKFRVLRHWEPPHYIDLRQPLDGLSISVEVKNGQNFSLQPGAFALGTTLEHVELPDDLMGRLEGKSSLGRVGLLIHSTAGYVDPGFRGQLTLELYNVAPLPIILFPGMKISQISFHRLSTPAERPYGAKGLGSKYQGQVDATPTRYYQEFNQPALMSLPSIAVEEGSSEELASDRSLSEWLKNSEFRGSIKRFSEVLSAPVSTVEKWVYEGARPGPRYRRKLFEWTKLPQFRSASEGEERELLPK